MSVTVTAKRWSGGWELWIDGDHVTQSRTLADAEQQVRDYLDTDDEKTDHSAWDIRIVPEVKGYREAMEAREAGREAVEAQEAAAGAMRRAVRRLRDQGVSTTDCAVMLGLSRGRISQLSRRSAGSTSGA